MAKFPLIKSKQSSGNAMSGMMPFISQMAMMQRIQQQQEQAVPNAQQVTQQMGGNIPPGTKFSQGGINMPLNRELTGEEGQTVATYEALNPTVQNIFGKLDKRILGDHPIQRTARQGLIDTGEPILTAKDPELQDLQGDFNHLKSILPFTFGGKQLTNIEKKLVFRLLNITGKSNDQIKRDLTKTMSFLDIKEQLVREGANADLSKVRNTGQPNQTPGMNQQSNQTDQLEGRIINNPQTKQRFRRQGGKWVPI